MTTLAVSEIFGPTFQGEGPSTGRRCSFLRLARCNLDCTWCDTPYTWDWKRFDPAVEIQRMDVEDVTDQLMSQKTELLVITGGEPLLQCAGITALLKRWIWETEIETNGTRPPLDTGGIRYNVSPKLAHSGVSRAKAIVPEAINAFLATRAATWKFVAEQLSDLDEVDSFVETYCINSRDVWIMPEGIAGNVITRRLVDLAPAVLERGWNLSGRLQVETWGNQRGV